jgi:hypothetical protein
MESRSGETGCSTKWCRSGQMGLKWRLSSAQIVGVAFDGFAG